MNGPSVARPAPALFNPRHPSRGVRMIQRWAGLPELDRIYEAADQKHCPSIHQSILDVLGVNWRISGQDLQRIPKTGGAIVVANHPFGLIEAVAIGALIEQVRPDVRTIANALLAHFPRVAERVILVDSFGGAEAVRSNRHSLRQSLEWLKQGGLLVVFPAGEVASFDVRKRMVTDPAWNKNAARLAMLAKVPVVPMYFEGHNGIAFQVAGLVHSRLRTALLAREFLNKNGKTLTVRAGHAVNFHKLASFESDEERIQYLRRKTYVLANCPEPEPTRPFLLGTGKAKAEDSARDGWSPLVEATDPELMRVEVGALPADALLVEHGENAVYLAEANRIPNVVREIGRLREMTFRQTGEGTGKSIDLDSFDTHYLHLFLWNRADREVIGAYRLGLSDRLLQSLGQRGFYTSTLFAYNSDFLERINPALELGRSFVHPVYQRSYAPLLLLWKGIGAFISRHPQYSTLFGPVSISNDYHPNSRQLIVHFLKEYCSADDLARLVRARTPLRTHSVKGWESHPANAVTWDIEDLSASIADIETDHKGVPILLKHYLKLGGKLVAFNLDPNFSNALDGLIVVDLLKTDTKLLERYMSRPGLSSFLRYHGVPLRGRASA